jgi:hypothetical protein
MLCHALGTSILPIPSSLQVLQYVPYMSKDQYLALYVYQLMEMVWGLYRFDSL